MRLPLFDFGGHGAPLLVVHATGFHAMVYRPMIERLSDAGWRVYAVDLRAHGDSLYDAETELRWERFAEDVLAVVRILRDRHEETLVAFGHSKGGAALLRAELEEPGSFSALFVYEPVILPPEVPNPSPDGPNPMADIARRRRASFPTHEQAVENYGSKPPYDAFAPQVLDWYVKHGFRRTEDGEIELKCRPEWEAEIYEMSRDEGPFQRLSEVSCSVTVARGGRVQPGPGAWAPSIAERLPHGTLLEFPGLGHLGPMEDPGVVAAAVLKSLAGREPR